jgi:CheY-like chemotaxis protein
MILLVDDDDDDVELFCMALRDVDEHIECMTAHNGEEAMVLLRSKSTPKPELIFLDMNMPRMNGRQCLANLKTDTELCDIPVVMYSTSKMEEDIDELLKLGATYFLTKPTALNELKGEIAFILVSFWAPVSKNA